MVAHGIQGAVLHAGEEVWVVTALPQLHNDVQNSRTGTITIGVASAIDGVNISEQNLSEVKKKILSFKWL